MGDNSRNTLPIKDDQHYDHSASQVETETKPTMILELPALGLAGMEIDNHLGTLSQPRENGQKRQPWS